MLEQAGIHAQADRGGWMVIQGGRVVGPASSHERGEKCLDPRTAVRRVHGTSWWTEARGCKRMRSS